MIAAKSIPVTTMTDVTREAGGARHQPDDDRAAPAVDATSVSLKVALVTVVVLVVGLAVVGVAVDLTWR
jgi:hypothetical protein